MKTEIVAICLILRIVGTAHAATPEINKTKLPDDVLAKLRKSCDKYGIKLALYSSEEVMTETSRFSRVLATAFPSKPSGTTRVSSLSP